MFEKYNVSLATTDESAAGGGGEYDVQTGFGWTNGVILDFLDKYGETVTLHNAASIHSSTFILLTFVLLFVLILHLLD